MTLNEIMKVVDTAYGSAIRRYWNFTEGRPKEKIHREDTVAKFLVSEVQQVFDATKSDAVNLSKLVKLLTAAMDQLAVVRARIMMVHPSPPTNKVIPFKR